MKRRWLALGALGLALLGSVPVMADDMVQNLDPSLHLFCRDDKRVFQPLYQGVSQLGTFKQTSLGALYEGMTRHFGWTGSLHSTSDTIGIWSFPKPVPALRKKPLSGPWSRMPMELPCYTCMYGRTAPKTICQEPKCAA
jgi:hypothetical protein